MNPSPDDFAVRSGRSPVAIDRMLRLARPFLRWVFRAEVTGLEKIPAGSYVFIANHNIGALWEILALLETWQEHARGREIFGLAHPLAFRIPALGWLTRRMGSVPATYETARAALSSGASLMIFPGGNHEAVRPFWRRHRCDFGGHRGWARIAITNRRAVVPISIVGSHGMNPILWQSRILVKLLLLPWWLGMSSFPVSVSQIVLAAGVFALFAKTWPLALALAWVTFVFTPLTACWPAKLRIRIHSPIAAGTDVDRLYDAVTETIQQGMDDIRRPRAES